MNTPKPLNSLKALAEGKAAGIQKATYFKVAPTLVEFEPGFNLREEGPALDEYIERIYHAMKAGAYFPPIDVRVIDGRILARDGHCRTRAALRLEAEGVSYLLEARQIRGNDADDVYHMLGTGSGLALSPLEHGRGFLRLINMGQTVAQIAARLGLHRSTIENGIALAEAPAAVQKLVADGRVASHTALKAVRQHGPKAAPEILAKGVQEAERAGKGKATGKHLEPPKPKGQTLPPVESSDQFEHGKREGLNGTLIHQGASPDFLRGYSAGARENARALAKPAKGRRADDPELSPAQVAALLVLARTVADLNPALALPPRAVAHLVAQAEILVGDKKDPGFGEKCVKFVQDLAARSTLVTYKGKDCVDMIEAAYAIVSPEGK